MHNGTTFELAIYRLNKVKLSEIITAAFDIRNDSDYEDFYILSKEEVDIQISDAEVFINTIEKYIETKK